LREAQKAVDEAVQKQDFPTAVKQRDRVLALEAEIQSADGFDATTAAKVDVNDIADIVSAWTGVPVSTMTESESAMLLHLEDVLHERLIGQQEAVVAVSRAIRRARVGLASPDRPIAALFFSGPTGVGKTELAKALAASMFGAEEAMIRLDMSEFMEGHTVSKLIGSPPGYVGFDEGGQLTEAVRRRPYSVILMDEVEKAHPDVFNLMLQIFEDGRLTDSKGRVVSFKNTLVIMTSNIGSKVIEKGGGGLGFELGLEDSATAQYNRIRNLVNEELKQFFRPELLNRLDEIIVFRQLTRDEVMQVAELMLKQVNARLSDRALTIQLTEAFKDRLIAEGYDPSYGARPMRRAIARLVEDNLAEAILAGKVQDGQSVVLDIDDDGAVQVYPERQPALVGAN
ncbi:MAG: AAA family ATPase, partial [Cyanobacteria bacterium J06659_2]